MVGIVPPPPPNISNVLGQEFSILRSKWVLASRLTGSSCLNLGESIAGAETWPPGTGLAEAGEVGGGGAVRSPRACGGGESPDRHGYYYFSPWASLPFRSEIWSERGGCLSRPRGTHADQEAAAAGSPGFAGSCRSRPSARGADSERRGSRGASHSASRDHLASRLRLLSQPAPLRRGSWERVPGAELRPTMPMPRAAA